jgi:hypothetical protein
MLLFTFFNSPPFPILLPLPSSSSVESTPSFVERLWDYRPPPKPESKLLEDSPLNFHPTVRRRPQSARQNSELPFWERLTPKPSSPSRRGEQEHAGNTDSSRPASAAVQRTKRPESSPSLRAGGRTARAQRDATYEATIKIPRPSTGSARGNGRISCVEGDVGAEESAGDGQGEQQHNNGGAVASRPPIWERLHTQPLQPGPRSARNDTKDQPERKESARDEEERERKVGGATLECLCVFLVFCCYCCCCCCCCLYRCWLIFCLMLKMFFLSRGKWFTCMPSV